MGAVGTGIILKNIDPVNGFIVGRICGCFEYVVKLSAAVVLVFGLRVVSFGALLPLVCQDFHFLF